MDWRDRRLGMDRAISRRDFLNGVGEQGLTFLQKWSHGVWAIGNIAVAGTDSSYNAMTESAMEEAYRAVHDLP